MSAAGADGASPQASGRPHALGIFATPTGGGTPTSAPRGRLVRRNRPGVLLVPEKSQPVKQTATREGTDLGKLVVKGQEYVIREGSASDFTRYGHLGAGAFGYCCRLSIPLIVSC